MTPLERLLAEELPTGTFGGARTAEPVAVSPAADRAVPDPRAAEHLATLAAEVAAARQVGSAERRAASRERVAADIHARRLRASLRLVPAPATATRKAAS